MLSTFKLTIINLLGDSFDLCVGNHTKLTNETPVASFAANLHFHISRFFKDFFLYMNVLPVCLACVPCALPIDFPGTGVTGACESPCEGRELLLTTESLLHVVLPF